LCSVDMASVAFRNSSVEYSITKWAYPSRDTSSHMKGAPQASPGWSRKSAWKGLGPTTLSFDRAAELLSLSAKNFRTSTTAVEPWEGAAACLGDIQHG